MNKAQLSAMFIGVTLVSFFWWAVLPAPFMAGLITGFCGFVLWQITRY